MNDESSTAFIHHSSLRIHRLVWPARYLRRGPTDSPDTEFHGLRLLAHETRLLRRRLPACRDGQSLHHFARISRALRRAV